jgi:hypothetical protein
VTVLLEAKLDASLSCSFVAFVSAAAIFGDAGTDDTFILLNADTCSILNNGDVVSEWVVTVKVHLIRNGNANTP